MLPQHSRTELMTPIMSLRQRQFSLYMRLLSHSPASGLEFGNKVTIKMKVDVWSEFN
jgi:hypothetical protein